MDKTVQYAVNEQVRMLETTAQDLLDTNAKADQMIQDAIKFEQMLGITEPIVPTTSEQGDKLLREKIAKKSKKGLTKIEEG